MSPTHHHPICPLCLEEDGEPCTADYLRDNVETCGEYIYLDPPRCHSKAGVLVEYCKQHATLTLACRRCHGQKTSFLIAEEVREERVA
jgi:hypothetical protein